MAWSWLWLWLSWKAPPSGPFLAATISLNSVINLRIPFEITDRDRVKRIVDFQTAYWIAEIRLKIKGVPCTARAAWHHFGKIAVSTPHSPHHEITDGDGAKWIEESMGERLTCWVGIVGWHLVKPGGLAKAFKSLSVCCKRGLVYPGPKVQFLL